MDFKKKLKESQELEARRTAVEKATKSGINVAQPYGAPLSPIDDDVLESAELFVREQHSKGKDWIDCYSGIKMLFKLTEEQAQGVVDRVKLGGTPEWKNPFCYWSGTGKTPVLTMDEFKFYKRFLPGRGYRKFMPGEVKDGYIFVQVVDRIIHERNSGQIKADIGNFIKSLPVQVAIDNEPAYRMEIDRMFIRQERAIFANGRLEYLPDLETNFLRDTKKSAFFVYRNGWIEVMGESDSKMQPLSTLPGLVWQKQIIDRDYTPPNDSKPSVASQFIFLISGKDEERALALRTAIGYLLHRYKSPSLNRAIITMDEQVSTDPNGGTGKSMIGRMIAQMRGVLTIDGRAFKPDKSFLFQRYRQWHNVVNFDDVSPWFDMKFIYVALTHGLTVERKGKDEDMIEYHDSPKILVSTNYSILGEGQSNERRRADYEFAPHFNANHQPKDEFGKQFFTEWNVAEWNRFDAFMHKCTAEFLQHGLILPKVQNRELRTFIQQTDAKFPEWIQTFLDGLATDLVGTKSIGKKDLYSEWLAFAGWAEKDLSDKKFRKWLDAYQVYSGCTITEGRTEAGGNPYGSQRFWKFGALPSQSAAKLLVNSKNQKLADVSDSESNEELPF